MRSGNRLNLGMYLQAFPLLFRHFSIVTAPLLAAVCFVLLGQLSNLTTDAVGGLGSGLYDFIARIIWLMAFGVAIVQANNIWNARDGSFDAAWRDAKGKLGGIALAAVGFTFLLGVAAQLGAYIGLASVLLLLAVAFVLIYMIPAASIGGMPAGYAISASYRAAVANLWPTVVLALVYIAFTTIIPGLFRYRLYDLMPDVVAQLVLAGINALVLSYLAFAFAKQYEEVA